VCSRARQTDALASVRLDVLPIFQRLATRPATGCPSLLAFIADVATIRYGREAPYLVEASTALGTRPQLVHGSIVPALPAGMATLEPSDPLALTRWTSNTRSLLPLPQPIALKKFHPITSILTDVMTPLDTAVTFLPGSRYMGNE
jgi:hypothetical protein